MLVRSAVFSTGYVPRVYTGNAQSAMPYSPDVMSPCCQVATVCVVLQLSPAHTEWFRVFGVGDAAGPKH
jgi:hypothetical protein